MRWLAALSLLVLASCNTANVKGPIDLSIATEGGFTGRGLGSVEIRDTSVNASTLGTKRCAGRLAESEHRALSTAIASARPAEWKRDYTPASNPHGYADQVRYTLTLDGRSVSWTDEASSTLPADLRKVHELAWRVRERVCAE